MAQQDGNFSRRRPVFWLLVSGGLSAGVYAGGKTILDGLAQKSLRRAETCIALGEMQEARELLETGAGRWAEADQRLYLLGLAYLDSQEYAVAAAYLRQVSAECPVYRDARRKLAGCLLLDDRLEETERVLVQHLDAFPDAMAVRMQLASVFSRQMRLREAVDVLTAGLQDAAGVNVTDRLELLRYLLATEFDPPFPEDCLPSIEVSLDRFPNQSRVRLAFAECLCAVGREADGDRVFMDELESMSATDCEVWIALCLRHLEAGRVAKAKTMLAQFPEGPGDCGAGDVLREDRLHLIRARIHAHEGDYQAAVDELRQADQKRPLTRADLARLARLLQQLGKPEEATGCYAVVHQHAKAGLAIWHLLRNIGQRTPTKQECLLFADHLLRLQRESEASAWRELADMIGQSEDRNRQLNGAVP